MTPDHRWLLIAVGLALLALIGIGAKELITWLMRRAREIDRRSAPPED
jgi:hypothetical protein